MPAPLAAAAMYFGLPRLLGYGADQAMRARYDTLAQQGVDPSSDTAMNLLAMVPRRSALENTFDAARAIYNMRNAPQTQQDYSDVSLPEGPSVYREGVGAFGGEFNPPMEDFLKYGGRDEDEGRLFGQAPASYYSQPNAPELNIGRTGDFDYGFGNESEDFTTAGYAYGGLATLARNMYAKR